MKEKLRKKISTGYILATIIVVAFIVLCANYANQYTEYVYELTPIENETYARYYTTHSRTPSENYEVITLYYNDSVRTLNGNVEITYTNEKPYVYIKDKNMVNADIIHAYIPINSVKYEQSITIGK